MYRWERRGSRMVPGRTPEETETESEDAPSSRTRWVLHVKKAGVFALTKSHSKASTCFVSRPLDRAVL